jgi:hypothetical protein
MSRDNPPSFPHHRPIATPADRKIAANFGARSPRAALDALRRIAHDRCIHPPPPSAAWADTLELPCTTEPAWRIVGLFVPIALLGHLDRIAELEDVLRSADDGSEIHPEDGAPAPLLTALDVAMTVLFWTAVWQDADAALAGLDRIEASIAARGYPRLCRICESWRRSILLRGRRSS